MAYKLPGASLSNYNSQLVENLDDLKAQSQDLQGRINHANEQKAELERRAAALTEELGQLNRKL